MSRIVALLMLAIPFLAFSASAQEKEDPLELQQKFFKRLLDRAEDEYRLFFKRPTKPVQFWTAMKFELEVGKFELAAHHLKLLLEYQPPDEADNDLIKIEETEGLTAFLRLRYVQKWSDYKPFDDEARKSVEALIQRLTEAVEKHLSEPTRIQKFIRNLDAKTIEERGYAFFQLERSKERAVPFMVEALRTNLGKPEHARIVEALKKMHKDVVPPLLEILKASDAKEAQDLDLRLTLLNILLERNDRRVVPYLWHLSHANQYPKLIRDRAREVLAHFLNVDITQVPTAKIILTLMAEEYYQHKKRFEPEGHKLWRWDGERLALKPEQLTTRDAEEFFGLRYAREALDLDPSYGPAQNVFLSLLLEREFDQDLDQFFKKPIPSDIQNLLASLDADMITLVLERALTDNQVAVALPIIQVLGQRGETRAARLSPSAEPRGLVRALYYPDRRVQFAASQALLRLPPSPAPVAAERVVDLLQRAVAADGKSKAMMAFAPADQAAAMREKIREIGFEPLVSKNLPETLKLLDKDADVDILFLHPALKSLDLSVVLSQIRNNHNLGRVPIVVLTKKENYESNRRTAQRFSNVSIQDEASLLLPNELKAVAQARIREVVKMPITAEERQRFAKGSLDSLWKMARGEATGYPIQKAQDAVYSALRSEDLALLAIEFLGRMPGSETQERLAATVTDPRYEKIQVASAQELNRHVQKFGLMLPRESQLKLRDLYRGEAKDKAELREALAVFLGSTQPTVAESGRQIRNFVPAARPAEEKKDDK